MTVAGVPTGALQRMAAARAWKGLWTQLTVPASPLTVSHTTQKNCYCLIVMEPRDTEIRFTLDPAVAPDMATARGWCCKSAANGELGPQAIIDVVGGVTMVATANPGGSPVWVFELLDEAPT